MNIFQELFRVVVYEPQLNLLYFFYQITGHEIGISVILLAFAVNLMILPIYAKSYINMQKTRILQPRIKEIQDTYKKDPQVLLAKMREFNIKHGISTGYVFLVLLVQLFFISGLYVVINDVVQGKTLGGLYSLFWGVGHLADFKNSVGESLAFGFIKIGASAKDYLWIPVIALIFSYLYGMYTFRWAPKPVLPKPTKVVKKNSKGKDEPPLLDPEAMQKSMEFQSIYILPIFLFVIQYSLPTGLNIYFATTSFIALIRQVFLTKFYTGHTDKLLADIAESDPSSKDNNPDNNPEILADPAQIASDQPVVEVIVKKKDKVIKKKKR
ncbi:MAG: YidC/Oxa1 family membrane protein insertase [bacterium]